MLKKRSAILMAVTMTVGSLFAQGVQGGCWNIDTKAFMTSIQPCKILDCGGSGIFGPNGALSLCGQPGAAGDVVTGCP